MAYVVIFVSDKNMTLEVVHFYLVEKIYALKLYILLFEVQFVQQQH